MMLIPQKMKFFYLTADHKYSITYLILKHQIQDTTLISMYTCRKRKMKKGISKPFHWTMNTGPLKKIPDRPLCIHKHSLPHGLCLYLCPYANYQTPSYLKTIDLSDISEYKDLMTTSSEEDIPQLEVNTY